ncbi:hypothetical protein D3C77_583100 [compost metagenome]
MTILIVGYDDDEQISDCLDLLRIYANGSRPLALLIPDKIEIDFAKYILKTKDEIQQRKEHLKRKFDITHVECVLDVHLLADPLIDFNRTAIKN